MEQEQQNAIPGWPVEPEFVSPFPARWDSQRDGYVAVQPQPSVVNNYYASPPPAKQGLQPSTVFAWALAVVLVCAALAAVAVVAVSVAVAAVAIAGAMCVLVALLLIVRGIWRDHMSGKGSG
jgi:hypothetical protein